MLTTDLKTRDTLNGAVLLDRLSVNEGRLRLPDGLSYRYPVLPQRQTLALSPPVLRKIKELVRQGATVLGPAPQRARAGRTGPKAMRKLNPAPPQSSREDSPGHLRSLHSGKSPCFCLLNSPA
jgi:hypothetical protein